jgi:hypothetical protein
MESLLQRYGKGQFQALVAQNDELAIGASSAIQAADRLGRFEVLIEVNGLAPVSKPSPPELSSRPCFKMRAIAQPRRCSQRSLQREYLPYSPVELPGSPRRGRGEEWGHSPTIALIDTRARCLEGP